MVRTLDYSCPNIRDIVRDIAELMQLEHRP